MKEITTRVYDYDELSPEAKRRAYDRWIENWSNPWDDEIRNTIEAFERALDIGFNRWEYGPGRSDYGTIVWGDSWNDDVLALFGNRARAWLWSNFGKLLLEPAVRYYCRNGFPDDKWHDCAGPGSKRYVSKVFSTRVYDGTCPLTGYCLDCDALDPMAYFCFGVKWDEKTQKRVMVPHDERGEWKYTTVEDIVRKCAASLFKAAQNDCEESSSEEYFAGVCKDNGFMFDENGNRSDVA